jgi:predicted component of type VI protein secretion system
MFLCRLVHRDQPFQEIDARLVGEGEITVGRDPSADWRLNDPDGTLSRIHCTLAVENGRLLLRDRSTNGTFLDSGERAPEGQAVELRVRDSIRLGALTILVGDPPETPASAVENVVQLAPAAPAITPAADWADGPAARPAHRDTSLIEAFCEGARLDASSFSSEDPAELMRRIGAIYQQTVLGLSALMADRARSKAEYELERTTINAADNNPFKWAPTRKLAQDLLRKSDNGFLSDAAAVRASFEDLGEHLGALADGASAAVAAMVNALDPSAIEAEAKAQTSMLRNKTAVCWDIHARRHADLTAADGGLPPLAKRAFGDAYLRSLAGSRR